MEDYNMKNTTNLINELKEFTGTEQFYKNQLFPLFVYTDGVKYLAEHAEAYWLIDYIFSNQSLAILKKEAFQVCVIEVKNDQAVFKVEDGNDNLVKEFKISYTDFPLDKITLWFTDRTLLLPSEY